MTTIFTQNGPWFVVLSENSCHFVTFLSFASTYFFISLRKIMWLNSHDFVLRTQHEALSYLISTVMSGQLGFQEFPFASLGGSDDLKKQNKFQPSTIMKLFTFHTFFGVVSSLHYTYRVGMFLVYVPKSFIVCSICFSHHVRRSFISRNIAWQI